MPNSSGPAVTAVIPTFNGNRYLDKVLRALAEQTLPADEYEVVVVDNNSTIDLLSTASIRDAVTMLRGRGVHFEFTREPRQGLTFARGRGVATARSPLVCFLDDDNEPVPGYLAAGLDALNDPAVGLLVSRVSPVYEHPPSQAILRREHLLALNYPLGPYPIRWAAASGVCPALGAGMWVRKGLYERIQSEYGSTMLSDRIGTKLVSGGDIEIGIAAGRLGFDRMYIPKLAIRHHIPVGRISSSYFKRLIVGVVRSAATIDSKYSGRHPWVLVRLSRLVGCVLCGWLPAVRRGDAFKEYQFIVVAAFARFQGPYK